MKLNKFLKTGLILVICFVVFTTIGDVFFEIRSKQLYDFTYFFQDLVLILTFILLTIGLYKLKKNWKWFIIIPLSLFAVFITITSFFFDKMPNQITIKDDTEILYINKRNSKKKVVRQAYWTGFTGDSYHSDTICVYELNPALRIIQKADLKAIDSSWTKIIMTK